MSKCSQHWLASRVDTALSRDPTDADAARLPEPRLLQGLRQPIFVPAQRLSQQLWLRYVEASCWHQRAQVPVAMVSVPSLSWSLTFYVLSLVQGFAQYSQLLLTPPFSRARCGPQGWNSMRESPRPFFPYVLGFAYSQRGLRHRQSSSPNPRHPRATRLCVHVPEGMPQTLSSHQQ